MPRNIEIKARIESVASLLPLVKTLAGEGPIEIHQDDTFFRCDSGRLKLRVFPDATGELIFYRRADQHGPKVSFYVKSPTSSPDTLREALTLAYGQAGRVKKHRTLFLIGRTRIHLDIVEGLGHFLELEVVLAEGEPAEAGVIEADALMKKLDIKPDELLEASYVDLVTKDQNEHTSLKEEPQRLVCHKEKGNPMGFMGFTLARDLVENVATIALTMGESDEAVVIPDSGDQVLVRAGSSAYRERMETKGVFMIPVELRTLVNGVEKQELFCVCTK